MPDVKQNSDRWDRPHALWGPFRVGAESYAKGFSL